MNENTTIQDDVTELASEARSMFADKAQTVREGIQTVREKGSEVGRRAAFGIEARRDSVASGLEGVAQGIHGSADAVAKAGRTVGGAAHEAADSLASAARYVRETRTKEMVAQVGALVRLHPGKTLLAAVAVGFVAGRAMRRG
ncbi:MAG TPA: hypothetical protein VIY56_07365 [Vicinamibacterales bacterium]